MDDRDNGSWHNGWLLDNGFGTNEYPRDQLNTALTWFASENHETKFGLDWQEVKWEQDVRHQSVVWRSRVQLHQCDRLRRVPATSGPAPPTASSGIQPG